MEKHQIEQEDEIVVSKQQEVSVAKEIATEIAEANKPLFTDEKVVGLYEEAIQYIREDREDAHRMYLNLSDMVLNEGDPSSATKEAMVNLLKIKTERTDQLIKIVDLCTRQKLKEKHTMQNWQFAIQNNKYEANNSGELGMSDVRKLIQEAESMEIDNDNKSQ